MSLLQKALLRVSLSKDVIELEEELDVYDVKKILDERVSPSRRKQYLVK